MAITYEKKGRIAYVTINRPDALNAIDPETNDELAAAFADFRDDPEVWVAILTGSGERAFCSGADLKTLIPHYVRLSEQGRLGIVSLGGITRNFDCWKPLIAAVNGYALAGGLELVLACDLRIASENARFGQPEVRWGLIPGAGGTQRLPRALPLAKALELMLTPTQLTADEALKFGLIKSRGDGRRTDERCHRSGKHADRNGSARDSPHKAGGDAGVGHDACPGSRPGNRSLPRHARLGGRRGRPQSICRTAKARIPRPLVMSYQVDADPITLV